MATIDLKGNTNFVFLKGLNNDVIVPRTNLAAVDLTTANGLGVTGNTIYANLATTADISAGTSGALVNAAVVKDYVSAYTHTSAAIPQSAISGLATKFSNTSNYVSTYTHSVNVIPTSAISGLATAITDGASAYVLSANVVPASAVNGLEAAIISGASAYITYGDVVPASAISGLDTEIKNGASSYVNSTGVIPVSAVNGLATEIANGASAYVNSSGVVPVSAVTELPFISSTYALLAEDGWTHTVSAGAGVTVTTNSDNFPERNVTVALKDYESIITLTGNTVTVAPGNGYKLDATAGSKTIAIGAFDPGLWGRESHIELFVTSAGYVHTGTNVTLVDPLEPDAVNNCTVRFHDGHAVISVEDHTETYMVNTTGTGSATSGTLAYGLKQTAIASSYIGFRSELNTSSIPTGGATATVVKHIVGNGMDVGPTITGNLIISKGATVRDVKLSGVTVTSGSVTLANATIVSGATVTMGTNGKLNFYAGLVDGTSAVINLNGTRLALSATAELPNSAVIKGCTITGGYNSNGPGGMQIPANKITEFVSCMITGNTGTTGGGVTAYATADCSFTSCVITGNTGTNGAGMFLDQGVLSECIVSGNVGGSYDIRFTSAAASVLIKDSTVGTCAASKGILTLGGSNRIDTILGASATVNILAGTSIALTTSISNAAIVVSSGGCVVNGAVIAAGTYKKITSVGGSASATV